MGKHSLSNYSDQVRSCLFILSTHLAQLLSVEVLTTLPCDTFTILITVEVKQRQQQYATKGSTSGLSTSSNCNDLRTIKYTG